MGFGGFVNTIRASENTWGEVRGFRTHPGGPFPRDLLRNANGGFLAENERKIARFIDVLPGRTLVR